MGFNCFPGGPKRGGKEEGETFLLVGFRVGGGTQKKKAGGV